MNPGTYAINKRVDGAIGELVAVLDDQARERVDFYGRLWQQLAPEAEREFRDRTNAATRLLTGAISESADEVLQAGYRGALFGLTLARTIETTEQFNDVHRLRLAYDKAQASLLAGWSGAILTKEYAGQGIQDIALRFEDTLSHHSRDHVRQAHLRLGGERYQNVSYDMMLYTLFVVSDIIHIPGDLRQMVHEIADDDEEAFDDLLAAIVAD